MPVHFSTTETATYTYTVESPHQAKSQIYTSRITPPCDNAVFVMKGWWTDSWSQTYHHHVKPSLCYCGQDCTAVTEFHLHVRPQFTTNILLSTQLASGQHKAQHKVLLKVNNGLYQSANSAPFHANLSWPVDSRITQPYWQHFYGPSNTDFVCSL